MKIFTKPLNLNGKELKEELAEVGIFVDLISDLTDGTIGFLTDNEELAASIVAAHNGTTVATQPTIETKLASVGLSLDELKAALGGN
jgi:hypothetical protein